MSTTATDTRALDELCINTIRTLSMDAVQKANSGHPGAPMGLAHLAYVLYTRVLRHNPSNADWPGSGTNASTISGTVESRRERRLASSRSRVRQGQT